MFYQFTSYFKFLFNSTNQHGVHSPFVYNLITLCFYKNTEINHILDHHKYKQNLLTNKNKIRVTDFGAGSNVFKSSKREIAKIAKVAGISNKKSKLLIRFIKYFKPKTILEIGTSLGLGTSALHIGNKKSDITTLEGCPETSAIAKKSFTKFNFKNIELITGDFSKTLPKVINQKVKFDLIYFDGNHQKEATLNYFENCLQSIHNDSIFIFDDIHWSKEMTEAWGIIKNHSKVTVTIDVFHWGIVFFRKEQTKEHFTVRV
jgi:predicted O-methyltransferase YrrM